MYAPGAAAPGAHRAKKLRYALEIADESGAAPCRPVVNALKRVQDTLGRLHDLQVLQHHVAAVGARRAARRRRRTRARGRCRRPIEDECRHLHGRYVALVAALRAAVERSRSGHRRS